MPSTLLRVLSPRERDVLGLLARGHTQKEIAAIFSISIKTVESHKANGMRKIGCERRSDLFRHAVTEGWPLFEVDTGVEREASSTAAADNASHELVARLQVILGCCDLAGGALKPEDALAIIQRTAREQLQPIETLLAAARAPHR